MAIPRHGMFTRPDAPNPIACGYPIHCSVEARAGTITRRCHGDRDASGSASRRIDNV
ncbi:hypothetical protein KPA97_03405 [Burkholderia cenocepacia]|nr:hypothetical protein [Burkholderia cenocepacia]MDR8093833.1 hypothetical protein [Burkholderia cenocepacia]